MANLPYIEQYKAVESAALAEGEFLNGPDHDRAVVYINALLDAYLDFIKPELVPEHDVLLVNGIHTKKYL
jgi:hypothetical protein